MSAQERGSQAAVRRRWATTEPDRVGQVEHAPDAITTPPIALNSHYHGRWLEPRRWIRYDGAPEALALAAVLAVPGLLVFDGNVQNLLLAMLFVSVIYTAVRKPLVTVSERLVAALPASILAHVPDRFLSLGDEEGPARITE